MVVKSGWMKQDPWIEKLPEPLKSHVIHSTSDHGWVCPHCGHKETLSASEMVAESYADMLNGERIEGSCPECDETYWLKAHVTTKFETSDNESFDEEKVDEEHTDE
jgi:uncharacterized protein with PIN domain